jgi:hypothetical protein
MAIAPDGSTNYVTSLGAGIVVRISTRTNKAEPATQLIAFPPTARPPASAPTMRQNTLLGAAWTVIPTANDWRHIGGWLRAQC